jgi:GcrA cell cycle regulator
MDKVWTDDRVDRLEKLHAQGLSMSQIEHAFKDDVVTITRSAVIGKLHRLGLIDTTRTARVVPAPIVEAPKPSPAHAGPVAVLDDGARVTVLTLSDRMCRWPIGDSKESEFHFCGHGRKVGSPYCDEHCRKAYQPQQSARKK